MKRMKGEKPMKKLLIIAIFIISPSFVFAQQETLEWFEAPLGQLPPIGTYRFTYYDTRDVKGQDTTLGLMEHNFFVLVPVQNKPDKDFALMCLFEGKNIDTDALLKDTDIKLPDQLYNLSFGPSYRCKFHNDWIGGIAFLFGSASNKLFYSKDELSYRLDAYIQIPTVGNNSWIFFVDYYNNREYLRNIPIPGVAYWYQPNDKLRAVLGLPVAAINYKPTDKLTLDLTYIMVTYVDAKISYDLTPKISVYGLFDWNNELYARADREKNKDRLFYYEKSLSCGVHFQVFKYAAIDLSGGFSFDRFFFEGTDYNKKDERDVDVENGAFVSLRAGIPF